MNRDAPCSLCLATADDVARLNALIDAAKIRAFFVAPTWARRGVGSRIPDGLAVAEHVRDRLPDGTEIDFVRMTRALSAPP